MSIGASQFLKQAGTLNSAFGQNVFAPGTSGLKPRGGSQRILAARLLLHEVNAIWRIAGFAAFLPFYAFVIAANQ